MTDDSGRLDKVKEAIRGLAHRTANVEIEELIGIVESLGPLGYSVRVRKANHGALLAIDDQRVNVCFHNRGSKQLKPVYVRQFLRAMIELGLYE
jgi:hypothetical protein